MAVLRSFTSATAALLLAQLGSVSATTFLSPADDIVLPKSDSASEPLQWLGANSPYFAGPNIHHINNQVPDGCTVEQVAYLVRHGSRYPDGGAYNQWTALYAKIQAATFTATGDLAFLQDWAPVLTNPTAQISQESSTGYKEAFDLGYQLRTRYPKLYAYGTPFITWANLYPRVVQTAQNFMHGFLGSTAPSLGMVYTVNSTGSPVGLFDSLSPSDQCPLFVDGNGGTEQTSWNSIYLPPILARLNTMISGNLEFTTDDVSLFPYLCGFESQITGTLSPWCGVFTDAELKQYEYAQDLRYYYGTGPGVDLASKMMLPFVNNLVGHLAHGPGISGTYPNGSSFVLPNIITAFMNDGQIAELGAAIGVWDKTAVLSGTEITKDYAYIASHFVTMRGTVAFERLNCPAGAKVKARDGDDEPVVTRTATQTTTICPNSTITSAAATEYTTSTVLSTSTYLVSACKHTDSACHRGQTTSTVITSETVLPVSATTTAAVSTTTEYATSTLLSTETYTITFCSHRAHDCHTGGLTTTVVTSTSIYPVSTTSIALTSPMPTSTSSTTSIIPGSNSTTSIIPGSNSTTISSSLPSSIPYPSNTTISSTTLSNNTTSTAATTTSTFSLPTSTSTSNQTYIRILLNDAVYPVPSCQSGPGRSCLMSEYAAFIAARLAAVGDLKSRCNVTNPAAPAVLQGASFLTNLGQSWVAGVSP